MPLVVKKLKPLPIEAIVRGYLVGSGWKEYQKSQQRVQHSPAGRIARSGQTAATAVHPIHQGRSRRSRRKHQLRQGRRTAGQGAGRQQVRDVCIALYQEAAEYAATKGIIIADTKFEFGLDDAGKLYLIDEALTPDSSRFWPADQYAPGSNPPSFDKQYVRDWLESIGWNKKPPAPILPADVAIRTGEKYREALKRLTEC